MLYRRYETQEALGTIQYHTGIGAVHDATTHRPEDHGTTPETSQNLLPEVPTTLKVTGEVDALGGVTNETGQGGDPNTVDTPSTFAPALKNGTYETTADFGPTATEKPVEVAASNKFAPGQTLKTLAPGKTPEETVETPSTPEGNIFLEGTGWSHVAPMLEAEGLDFKLAISKAKDILGHDYGDEASEQGIDALAKKLTMESGLFSPLGIGGSMTHKQAQEWATRAYAEKFPEQAASISQYTGISLAPGMATPEAQAQIEATATAEQIQERLDADVAAIDSSIKQGEFLDIQRADDPEFRQSLSRAAGHVIAAPSGWSYQPPRFDEEGRLITGGRFEVQKVKEGENVGQPISGAAQLSVEQQKQYADIFERQWRAQDLLSRIEEAETGMIGKRAEWEYMSEERRQAATREEEEAARVREWQTQERQATAHEDNEQRIRRQEFEVRQREGIQDFKKDFEFKHQEALQGTFGDRATHEEALQSMAQDFQSMSQKDQHFYNVDMLQKQQLFARQFQREWDVNDRESQEALTRQLVDLNKEARLAEARLAHSNQESITAKDHTNLMAQQDNVHANNMLMVQKQNELEKGIIVSEAHEQQILAGLQGKLDRDLQTLRDNGTMNRLKEQLSSDATLQGRRIDAEAIQAKAERLLKGKLQEDQLAHEVTQLGTQGTQALAHLTRRGEQDRLTLTDEIKSRELLAGRQITHEEAMQTAETTSQKSYITERGVQERLTLGKQFELQRQTLGTVATPIENTRQVTTSYTTTLNNAITQATASGDYSTVNDALASELPPMPPGIQWNSQEGGFRARAGFEGREMDATVREWISALTPAFKARDRAGQAVQQANLIQLDLTARRQDERRANEDFRANMLTGDIDSAEEAAARQSMAETSALAAQTKMEHLNMLFSLLQNPVQLGMAKRHGLLGQIEAVLGFTMDNVPVGPAGGAGSVPNTNEWQTMDSDDQTFSLAAYVEQGGSPDEFLRLVATSAPAQMQQVAYGVL